VARSILPSLVATAESAAASRAVRARRASPPASRTMWSSASFSRVTVPSRPRSSAMARSTRFRTSSSVSERSCSTSDLDSSGETTEKNGFSVVAATRSTIRSSTAPSRASCWVREKRCTSSMNRTVDSPEWVRRRRASSMTPRTSLTPADSAESATKRRPIALETSIARVVLPVPGGPYSISDAGAAPSTSRRSGAPGPSRWSWPTTSSRVAGRMRTASGAFALTRSFAPGWCSFGGLSNSSRSSPSSTSATLPVTPDKC
jgi:hypothetical protein